MKPFLFAKDERHELKAIEKALRLKIPEGDVSVLEKLPPLPSSPKNNPKPKKPNPNKNKAKASKAKEAHSLQEAKTFPQDSFVEKQAKNGLGGRVPFKKRRNRPGSRARRRLRGEI